MNWNTMTFTRSDLINTAIASACMVLMLGPSSAWSFGQGTTTLLLLLLLTWTSIAAAPRYLLVKLGSGEIQFEKWDRAQFFNRNKEGRGEEIRVVIFFPRRQRDPVRRGDRNQWSEDNDRKFFRPRVVKA